MKESEQIPRYIQAKEYLLQQIKKLKAGNNQLEPENTLTEKLGMSRETVRKAMMSLIQEGVITRWHGKGNFGHPAVTNLSMRIDQNSDFRRLLSESGYSVRTFRSEATVRQASETMAKRMPEAQTREVVAYQLDYYADSALAVQGKVELLKDIVIHMPAEGEYNGSMNAFLREHCISESNHTTAWLLAEHNTEVAQRFSLLPDTALLCWEEIYFNLFDEKMGYVKVFFNPKIMDLSLLLKF